MPLSLFMLAMSLFITMSCVGETSRQKMNACIREKASKDTHNSVVSVLAYSECVRRCKTDKWDVKHTCENDYYEEAGILSKDYYAR